MRQKDRFYVEGRRTVEGEEQRRVGIFASSRKALAFVRTLLDEGCLEIDWRTYDEQGNRA